MKFAGILHCLKAFFTHTDTNSPIDSDTIKGAIKFTNFFAGQVIRLLELYNKKDSQHTLDGYQQRLVDVLYTLQDKVQNGLLPLSEIQDTFNKTLPKGITSFSAKMVGTMLRKFGLKTERGTGGAYRLVWDDLRLQKMFTKFTQDGKGVNLVNVVCNKVSEPINILNIKTLQKLITDPEIKGGRTVEI